MTFAFLREHPYLAADLLGLLTVAITWLIAGPQRRMMLLAGLMLVPFFPIAALFSNGTYWQPGHVQIGAFGPTRAFGGPAGLEDILFLFIAGARGWFFATLPEQRRWHPTASATRFVQVAVAMTATAFAALGILRMLGIGYTSASYLVPAAIGVSLLCLQPGHWRLAASGALGSVVLSGLELRLWFALWPDWRFAWTPDAATSRLLLGVPIGDLLWWGVVGAVHPLVVARCAAMARRGEAERRTAGAE